MTDKSYTTPVAIATPARAAIIALAMQREQERARYGNAVNPLARHASKCWGTKRDQRETDD